MHSLEISILKTVSYFDVFSYPLTFNEIIFFLDQPAEEKDLNMALDYLVETESLFQLDNFYSIRNEPNIAHRRRQGNMLAVKHIKKAKAVAKFLSWFPYIKGIAISGSLSKNFADENSDLDFFIITAANRLWIVRILYSVLFKMATAARVKNWFCLNYFIDEDKLEIGEQNMFTAVEVATLIPLKGGVVFKDFFGHNNWVYQYLPNHKTDYTCLKDAAPILPKRIAEWMMNAKAGDKLDDKLHLFFKERFQKILSENKLSEKGLTIGSFKADKHACKPLPQYFQPVILERFHERFVHAKEKYNSELIKEKRVS
ncbi:MAG TPA: nucleotidyltransferase domain-containing protein [Parafilimonas sp.]|nr:nucleotidyltransferase domain-containing protein [Parafilimonas sp.]